MKSKFYIGQFVRVIGNSHGWGDVKYGDIGIIRNATLTEIYLESTYIHTYIVDFPNHKRWRGAEKCFEKITNKDILKLKIEL
jgi:hypothetical protein